MLNHCWFNVGLRCWTNFKPTMTQRTVSNGWGCTMGNLMQVVEGLLSGLYYNQNDIL